MDISPAPAPANLAPPLTVVGTVYLQCVGRGAVQESFQFAQRESATTGGRIGIIAIRAGKSLNGHTYGPAALRESVPLWEGRPVYADHPRALESSHSINDLLGRFYNARWDESLQAIVGEVEFLESATKIREAAAKMPELIGFSIMATAEYIERFTEAGEFLGAEIVKFIEALSVDAVDFPAAGGRVQTVLEQRQSEPVRSPKEKETTMETITREAAKIQVMETERRLETEHGAKVRVLEEQHASVVRKLEEASTALRGQLSEVTARAEAAEAQVAQLTESLDVAKAATAKAESVKHMAVALEAAAEGALTSKAVEQLKALAEGETLTAEGATKAVAEKVSELAELRASLGAPTPAAAGSDTPPAGAPIDTVVSEAAQIGKGIVERLTRRLGTE